MSNFSIPKKDPELSIKMGQEAQRLREALGFSLETFSISSGLSPQEILNFEKGYRITQEILDKIAKTLWPKEPEYIIEAIVFPGSFPSDYIPSETSEHHTPKAVTARIKALNNGVDPRPQYRVIDKPLDFIFVQRQCLAFPAAWNAQDNLHSNYYIKYRDGILRVYEEPEFNNILFEKKLDDEGGRRNE